ncbi:hypothetical protein ACIBBD_20465 [Streptomyces sp. NPDC051315]|uniref:hypothetical protein n=1 Tax=Streptomyces sp. NPDC051315 TaxID=3365650 RepID=UPI00378A3CCA
MPSPGLAAALADLDTVFNGFASPDETPCPLCHLPEETAYLRTPYTRIPVDVVNRYLYEAPGHFADHAAAMRRLPPQGARVMVEGGLHGVGWGRHGLSNVDWRTWPAEQAAAVEAFVLAWWEEVLTAPEPPYPAHHIVETCAMILRGLTPLLERWRPGPAADAHLLTCVDWWMDDLLIDKSPFSWFVHGSETALPELRAWLSRHAPARLRALGETDLAIRAGLLALPYDDRWAHPYWYSASATN